MKKSILIMAGAMLMFGACQKDKPVEITESNTNTADKSLEDFYQDNFNEKLQTFIVDANSPITVTGNQGSVLTIPANNFLDINGNIVAGDIEVKFIEVFSKADMILLNKPTVTAEGEALLSDGEFFIDVTLPGSDQSLRLVDRMTLTVPDETVNPDMKLWVDHGDGWVLDQGDDRTPDGLLEPYDAGYVASVTSGWMNFDLVYTYGPTMPVRILVPPGTNPASTSVFISMDGMSTVIDVDQSWFNGWDAYNCDAPASPNFITVGVIQEDPGSGDNMYNIIYSFQVTTPGQTINLSTLLYGSIAGMDADLNSLP